MHRREFGFRGSARAAVWGGCAVCLGLAGFASIGLTQPTAATATPAAPVTTAEEAARRAEVVAQFGATKLRVGQLEDTILQQNPFMQQRYVSAEAVRALLERNLRFEVLAAEALRLGYDKDVAVRLAVKQNAVQALIKQEFDDKITPESIAAADVAKYYAEHHDEFAHPETRRANLLIVATQDEANALLPEAKAGDLRAFRELARNKSVDLTNRQRGGDLRYFDATGRLVDTSGESVDVAVAEATFALKVVGDTSGVIKLGDRFAIVKLTGQRPKQDETLSQCDERIRTRLWRERREAAIDAKLGQLRQQLKPEVHPELVDLVQLDTGPALPPAKGLPAGFPHTRPGPIMNPPAE
jgi:parvulin-like peptidyl-prolyl isomerase